MAAGRQAAAMGAFEAQRPPAVTFEGLRHAGANLGLAAMFFVAAIPSKGIRHLSAPADLIWSVGMVLMGIFCIGRPKPSAVMLDWRAMVAGASAMVLPALMRSSTAPATGALYPAAVVFEFFGVAISQIARVYMGRAFAVLPANRGIVSSGPFRFLRHPVYLGWFLLGCGHALVYPTAWNATVVALCLPFTVWRISLEEELLSADPDYRAYLGRVRWRMVPGIY